MPIPVTIFDVEGSLSFRKIIVVKVNSELAKLIY